MADNFVDVDFTKEPKYTFGDLGAACFGNFGAFDLPLMTMAEVMDWVTKTDAEGGGLDELVIDILDQLQEGSCVGNAETQGNQVKQAVQFGKDRVIRLSAISMYKQIGRSAQSGAMVSDAMDASNAVGQLPLDTPENRARFGAHVMPATGFSNPFPSGWKETAKKFRGVEFSTITSLQQMYTAVCKGNPVIVGRQGHSICYLRPTMRNGRLVMKYANSWDESWGENGFGYDSESLIKQSASWAFAIRSVTIPE